jgi:UDP-glucose 4-epimerase
VREVIGTASRVTGVSIKVAHGPRREGDPPVLVASAERARKVLGWQASRSSLERIVGDAWRARKG